MIWLIPKWLQKRVADNYCKNKYGFDCNDLRVKRYVQTLNLHRLSERVTRYDINVEEIDDIELPENPHHNCKSINVYINGKFIETIKCYSTYLENQLTRIKENHKDLKEIIEQSYVIKMIYDPEKSLNIITREKEEK